MGKPNKFTKCSTSRRWNAESRRQLQSQLLGDHLRVWRTDGADGITWDDLQAVKNDMVGPMETCIEVYPPATEVVDEANVRHLWVVDADCVPSLFTRRSGTTSGT